MRGMIMPVYEDAHVDTIADMERILKSQEITFGKHTKEAVKTLIKIGRASLEIADYAKAHDSFKSAMDTLIMIHGETHQEVLCCVEQLATIADAQCNIEEADRLRQKALSIRQGMPTPKAGALVPKTASPMVRASAEQQPSMIIAMPPPGVVPSADYSSADSTSPISTPLAASTASSATGDSSVSSTVVSILAKMRRITDKTSSNPSTKIPAKTSLVIRSSGKCVSLRGQALWIGKDSFNDIPLPSDPTVAKSHAVIELCEEKYWIRPCGDYPTLLNGKQVSGKEALSVGDIVTIGETELQCE